MFRDSGKSKMSYDKVGVGSTVEGEFTYNKYLFVSVNTKQVGLLDLVTMDIDGDSLTKVEDINHFSCEECRLILEPLGKKLQWAFTDFDITPKGLKVIK